jgi:hypothetical protein
MLSSTSTNGRWNGATDGDLIASSTNAKNGLEWLMKETAVPNPAHLRWGKKASDNASSSPIAATDDNNVTNQDVVDSESQNPSETVGSSEPVDASVGKRPNANSSLTDAISAVQQNNIQSFGAVTTETIIEQKDQWRKIFLNLRKNLKPREIAVCFYMIYVIYNVYSIIIIYISIRIGTMSCV